MRPISTFDSGPSLETTSGPEDPALATGQYLGRERHAALYVGAVVSLGLLLIQQGRVTVSDGTDMLAVSQSIVHHGSLAVGPQFGVIGRGGHYFAKYGIGLSLVSIPFVALGDLVSLVAGNQAKLEAFFAASLVPLLMGLLAASLFRTARKLGAGSRWAAVLAIGSVFGTYALPYGKDFFAEPLTMLAIVLSIELVVDSRFALAGVALAVAITTRPESVVLAAILPMVVWVFRGFRQAFVYGAIAAIGAIVDAAYDQYRFGSVVKSGYGSEGFTTPFLHGASGLLFSPAKSLLLFAPFVFLVVVGSIRLWTAEKRFVVVLTVANFLVFFVLSATWDSWQGGWSWGPRLLLPGVIPTILLLSLLTRRERCLGIALLVAGFVISASTIVISTRAQQLDHPLPSIGPSAVRQYQLVPTVTRYTVDHLQGATSEDSRRYLALWQVVLREFGAKGLLASVVGSLILVGALIVAIRRSPLWRSHSPPISVVAPQSTA